MRVMIAVPCMETVHTLFFASMLALRKPEGTEVAVASCSLVYEARQTLAAKAVNEGFDRVLWLDSDVSFAPDLLERLSADLDQGRDFVCGLYFTRKRPVQPCVYDVCHNTKNKAGKMVPTSRSIAKIPKDIFEVEGCGFGAVMMTTDLIRRCGDIPFFPRDGYGEDLTFCRLARKAGYKLYCDPSVKVDHIGTYLVNESVWLGKKE